MEFCSNWPSNFLHLVAELMLLIYFIDATVRFTDAPPKLLYIPINRTAKFKWDYDVTDNELKDLSPTWELYLPNGSSIRLAYENQSNRSWRLSDSCPERLRGRLKIESPGTLVISQVNYSDSGIYGCVLRLKTGELLTNTSQLVVFDPPAFTNPPPDKVVLQEGGILDVTCSASGDPVPIVTWSSPKGTLDIISHGSGSARLRIMNIRSKFNGTYMCQANNKLQKPITKNTTVVIYYRPSVHLAPSTLPNEPSWDKHMVNLHCLATGNPLPNISWRNPSGHYIHYGVSSTKGGSLLTLITKVEEDYGEYKCRASNSRGYDEMTFRVDKIAVPDPPIIRKFTSDSFYVSLKWRMAPNDGGSPIIDYRILINTDPVREVSVKNNIIVIAALEEDTNYLVNISARNVVGYGNATSVVAKTKKGSSFSSSKSSTTALAVCLPIIFILVLVIIALLIYLCWRRTKSKGGVDQEDAVQSAETDTRKEGKGNAVVNRSKQNGHVREESERNSGSCFQPFIKRPRRRPGRPRSLPLHILDPIKEENTDEDCTGRSPEVKDELQEQRQTSDPVKYEEITIEPDIVNTSPSLKEVSLA